MSVIRSFLGAALVAAGTALPALSATLGQPLLVIDAAAGGNPTGSILDVFDGGAPSGLKEVSVGGVVSGGVGAASAVGKAFSLDTSLGGAGTLTLGTTTLDETGTGPFFTWTNPGPIPFDPFLAGPGDLNIALLLEPPTIQTGATFDFGIDFEPWSGATKPEIEVLLSIFLAGPLPTETFTPPIQDGPPFDFVEGTLSIARIEIATVGGAPLPPIPVPASLPLLLGALGALAWARRRT